MSRRLLGTLLILAALAGGALGVTDALQDESSDTASSEVSDVPDVSDAVKFEEEQDADDFQSDIGDEVPVGRTLLLLHLLKQKLNKLHQLDYVPTTSPPFTGCICVPFYLCSANGTIITDGTGIIDYRQRRCTGDLEVCCYLRFSSLVPPATTPTTMRPPPPTPVTQPTTPSPRPPSPTPVTQPTTPSRPPSPPTPSPTPPSPRPPSPTPVTQPTTPSRPPSPPTPPPPPPPTPVTQPTTPSPRPTVPTLPPFYYCTCVPVYQCAFYAGAGIGGVPGVIDPRQQYANTCVGAFVCCSYAPVVPVLPSPLPATPSFPPFVLPSVPPPTVPTIIPAPPVVLPPIIYGQSCFCTLISGCLQGWIPMSGTVNIDPRLILGRQGQAPGTCGANSMCCRVMQDNATLPLGPAAVPSVAPPTVQSYAPNFVNTIANIKNAGTPNACACVAANQCAEGNAVTYDNLGAIDPRFGPCASATLVCCRLSSRQRSESEVRQAVPTPIVVPPALTCGVRDTTYAATSQQTTGSTYFAEFPWMALLLIRRAGSNDIFQCGGSLINSRTVLTAAHCVVACDPGTLIVRLGEWNTQNANEPLPSTEYPVQRIVVHPQFYGGALYNDVALVVLQRQVTYAVNIRPVCLAAAGQIFAPGTTCYASGWGRNQFGANGQYQTILRKVDLLIIDNANCQARLRLTRLGQNFQLHPSFICAGGVASKDTCYKDGGGPLVCQESGTGRFTQSGIISWGIGCGDSTPAVYASVAYARQWIDQQLALLGITNA